MKINEGNEIERDRERSYQYYIILRKILIIINNTMTSYMCINRLMWSPPIPHQNLIK